MPTDKFIVDSDEEADKDYKPSKKQETDSDEEFVEEDTEKKGKSSDNKKRPREEEEGQEIVRDDDGNPILPLTNKRRLIIRQFPSGDAAVDIREVYQDKNTQKMRPGKGICLPLAQWLKLKELLPEVDRIIESLPSKKQK